MNQMQRAFQAAIDRAEGRDAKDLAERVAAEQDRREDVREDFRRREDRPRTAIGPEGAPEFVTNSITFTTKVRASSAGAIFQREIKLKRGRHRVTDSHAGDVKRPVRRPIR